MNLRERSPRLDELTPFADLHPATKFNVLPKRRLAVEIRGFCAHAEVRELVEVLDVIDGMTGRVHIIDTLTGALLYEGSTGEVYDAIVSQNACSNEESEPCKQRT